ncbi:MAG: 7-cyano-7-deazaguanine synthase QueC [Zoogloeaceae bacterium]|jgi:7-cyano-7-deazaguanine synthase|nr:7-cyano-7-deazaguanine synthase QueC [Zoogloeaceae bacterium]
MAARAVVLLSGGLDSATCLAKARHQGFAPYCLSFAYGQRHAAELDAARQIAQDCNAIEHRILTLDLAQFGGSALTDPHLDVPVDGGSSGIPITYVPARNTIMLSLALAWAEVLQSRDIFIGVNAVDYSGYPDCRPEYIAAFEAMANLATKSAIEGEKFTLHTPLIHLSKAEIIRLGNALGVNYNMTVSCYQADSEGRACGRCDSCRLRRAGFMEAGVPDPTRYRAFAKAVQETANA